MMPLKELEEDEIEVVVLWRAKWGGKEYSDSLTINPSTESEKYYRVLQAPFIVSTEKQIAEAKVLIKLMSEGKLEEAIAAVENK